MMLLLNITDTTRVGEHWDLYFKQFKKVFDEGIFSKTIKLYFS